MSMAGMGIRFRVFFILRTSFSIQHIGVYMARVAEVFTCHKCFRSEYPCISVIVYDDEDNRINDLRCIWGAEWEQSTEWEFAERKKIPGTNLIYMDMPMDADKK